MEICWSSHLEGTLSYTAFFFPRIFPAEEIQIYCDFRRKTFHCCSIFFSISAHLNRSWAIGNLFVDFYYHNIEQKINPGGSKWCGWYRRIC